MFTRTLCGTLEKTHVYARFLRAGAVTHTFTHAGRLRVRQCAAALVFWVRRIFTQILRVFTHILRIFAHVLLLWLIALEQASNFTHFYAHFTAIFFAYFTAVILRVTRFLRV